MGNCCSPNNNNNDNKRRVVILGLDSAGKDLLVESITQNSSSTLNASNNKSVAFKIKTYNINSFVCTIWIINGDDKSRLLWRHYLTGTQGLVFVVDSTDEERLKIAHSELLLLAKDPQLFKSIFLIFFNKQDHPNALSIDQIKNELGLSMNGDVLKEFGDRPFNILGCSAIKKRRN